MAYESEFDEMFPSTVTVTALATGASKFDRYGNETFGSTSATFRARHLRKHEELHDGMGNVVAVSGTLWVASTGSISPEDRVTLPDGSNPPIVSIERPPDQDGPHHHKIMLGY